MKVVALGLVLVAAGCASVGDVHFQGKAGAMFRRLTGAQAMTVSEKQIFYGTEDPPTAQLICHEHEHEKQFRVIADALVILGAVDNDDESRRMAAIAVYALDWIQYGANNRFEKGARASCPGP